VERLTKPISVRVMPLTRCVLWEGETFRAEVAEETGSDTVARDSYPGNSTFLEQSSELFVLGHPEAGPCTVAYSTRTTHNAIRDFPSLLVRLS
jgi:hypothetical protein